jgi:hypothetical protein
VLAVVTLLGATLDSNNAARNAAEKQLGAFCLQPTWPAGLLSIIGDVRFPANIRLAAALSLKRATREHWHYDDPAKGPGPYPEEVKAFSACHPWRLCAPAAAWARACPSHFTHLTRHPPPPPHPHPCTPQFVASTWALQSRRLATCQC